jgi:hypothetical protein
VLQLSTALKFSNPVGDCQVLSAPRLRHDLTDSNAMHRVQGGRMVMMSRQPMGVSALQTVSITAVKLAYVPSATYGGERRRLLHVSRRTLQGIAGEPAGVLQFLSPHALLPTAPVKTTPIGFY